MKQPGAATMRARRRASQRAQMLGPLTADEAFWADLDAADAIVATEGAVGRRRPCPDCTTG